MDGRSTRREPKETQARLFLPSSTRRQRHQRAGFGAAHVAYGIPVATAIVVATWVGLRRAFAERRHLTRPHTWTLTTLANRVALEFTGIWQYLVFGDRFIVPEAPKHFGAARAVTILQIWLLFVFTPARTSSSRTPPVFSSAGR